MVVPTLVIGIGMGGIRVVQTLAEFVEEKGEQKNYRFIAIDSNKDDLQSKIKSHNIVKASIGGRYDIEPMISACPYLYDGMGKKGVGAMRDRIYARFLLDLNMSDVKRKVEAALRGLKDDWSKEESGEKKGQAVIWLVHTLGGGTGSGTFPSLVVNLHRQAKQILDDAEIKSYIFCVGILPSATNIMDITYTEFDKKYLANSYAALRELELLSNPKELTLKPFNPFGSGEEIKITEVPFNRYFLFGIAEDMVAKLKDDEAETVEEYLKSSNKIIANMMYAVPKYPHGLENLWRGVKSPFIAFGESELIVPVLEIKSVADANDRLGKTVDEKTKKKLKAELKLFVNSAIGDLNEGFLEDKGKAILGIYKLRGLSYFIGKLQNEFNKKVTAAQSDFEENIEDTWSDLNDEEWAEDEIQAAGELSIGDKYEKIEEILKERMDDLQVMIDSPWHILSKNKLIARNKSIESTLDELDEKKGGLEKLKLLKSHIDSGLCKSLRKEIGHENDGVAEVTKCIRKLELEVEKMYKRLSEVGEGRVVKLRVAQDIASRLTLEGDKTNVANVEAIPDFIKVFGIKDKEVSKLLRNRVEQAKDIVLRVKPGPRGGEEPSHELFILSHGDNEPILGKHENTFDGIKKEPIITETFDIEKYTFVNFLLGISLEDIKEYTYRKEEYKEGKLARTAGLNEDIGKIFAYPEWFMDDPNVRSVFKKLTEIESTKSPEIPKTVEPPLHIATKKITDGGRLLVDGSNVAWESKKDGKPNIDNIEIIRLELEKEGYSNPIILVDANLMYKIPESDKERFKVWLDEEKVKQSPAQIRADETILKFADDDPEELKIVSNDTFRGYKNQYQWLNDPGRRVPFNIIEGRAVLHFR